MDIAVQAMAGIMSATGFAENPPVKSGVALCDFFAGIHLYAGVVTALVKRERTGKGSFVDVSMQESVFPSFASNLGLLFDNDLEETPDRVGNLHGGLSIAPYGVYPAKDGYTSIICNNDRHWECLLDAMGKSHLKNEPKLKTMASRLENLDLVTEEISNWSCNLSRSEIMKTLNQARVPCGSVNNLREVIADENLHARGMIRWASGADGRKTIISASPIHIDGINKVPYRAPPALDANRVEILSELKAWQSKTLRNPKA